MDLRKLRHLVVLADVGNFTRAAHSLHISQPALSRSIATLEDHCGERLFERSAEGAIPTTFCRPLIARARRMLADADRFERDLNASARGEIGRLSFGAGPLVAALTFAPMLQQLARERPGLEVRATIGPGHVLGEAVRRDELEFAVIAQDVLADRDGLIIEEVGNQTLAVLVRTGHPLAARRGLQAEDLAAYPLATGSAPDQGEESAGAALPPNGGLIVCDSFTILREVVAESDAMWLASIGFASRNAGLVPLDFDWDASRSTRIVRVRAVGRTLSPPAREASMLIAAGIASGAR
ncbi:LysR family transcriptional regulator [Novosphingobium malaysiense]|uniref:HTH lysR-type domain-containing protein n=1 Tax=Novosphingobium malaysiense TaxID=1348853 RepID=A0A0B1ZIU0_9SPHN|nr:LysR family transcriptional regulator [Novosphingobium malaysiense]KHK89188.1 hypothetical protein LK12_21970 [Novosphingobium malaysiense]